MSGGLRVGSSNELQIPKKTGNALVLGPPTSPPACASLRSCQWRLVVARRSRTGMPHFVGLSQFHV
jgi:hypothetical protein